MANKKKTTKRPIDAMANETYSWWGKSFVFIQKTHIKTWQAVFLMAFIAGSASTSLWAISNDWSPFSQAAEVAVTIPNDSCIATPAGGTYFKPVSITIKCGKKVERAYYQWSNGQPILIKNKKATIKYQAMVDLGLKISGVSKGGYGYGYGSNGFKKFEQIYYFKTGNIGCKDSDGGRNGFIKGTVTGGKYGSVGYNHKPFTDYCNKNKPKQLIEYSCVGKAVVQSNTAQCPNGCKDGACVASSTAIDSIKKIDSNVASTTKVGSASTDYDVWRSCYRKEAAGDCLKADFDKSGGVISSVDYNELRKAIFTYDLNGDNIVNLPTPTVVAISDYDSFKSCYKTKSTDKSWSICAKVDFDEDKFITLRDYNLLRKAISVYDLNGDGAVNFPDNASLNAPQYPNDSLINGVSN